MSLQKVSLLVSFLLLLYFHLYYTLALHMCCIQLYLLCTLYVCVISLTYYKIAYPLQYVLFLFKIVYPMNFNDNHSQAIIEHAIQLCKFVYDIYIYLCVCVCVHSCVHIVHFSLFTTECSFLNTRNLAFMLLSYRTLKLFLFMPKYHDYRIPMALLRNILPSSPLKTYRSQDSTPFARNPISSTPPLCPLLLVVFQAPFPQPPPLVFCTIFETMVWWLGKFILLYGLPPMGR